MKRNHLAFCVTSLVCCLLFSGVMYAPPKTAPVTKKRSSSISSASGAPVRRRVSVESCDAAALGTEVLSAEEDADVVRAARLLEAGELVALPTETVYGLGADAGNPEAVLKIFAAKNRPTGHPLIVHVASSDDIREWAKNVPLARIASLVAAKLMPGPLTVILDKADWVPSEVTGGKTTIGLRIPSSPSFANLLAQFKPTSRRRGIAAPSANLHQHTSTTNAEDVLEELGGRIAAVLDGGQCDEGMESTIVDLTRDVPVLLRPGPITREQLGQALGVAVEDGCARAEDVPGAMKIHYQPTTPAFLMSMDEIKGFLKSKWGNEIVAVLHYSPFEGPLARRAKLLLRLSGEKRGYAHALFTEMHKADRCDGCSKILIEEPPAEWTEVIDRLSKATARV